MGERIRDKIKAPSWVITLMAGVLITFMSFTIRTSARAQEMKSDIKTNQENIEKLDEGKGSKDKVDMTYDIVLRIERKLDDHISKTTQ